MKPRGGLTDIKLVDYDASAAESRVVAALEEALNASISTADPRRLIALALCQSIVQTCINADYGAKQTLLSYATGEALDHLGYYMNVSRPQATRATCVATFKRSSATEPATVQAGLICKGGDLEWETAEAITFDAGVYTVNNAVLVCRTYGTVGNGVAIGQINTIVTPSVVLNSVTNTSASHGAIDESDDEAYAELIRLGSDAFSVAGPIGAYEYYAKSASSDVLDVSVVSPSAASVVIYILATGGTAPSGALRNSVLNVCSADTVRPVGDRVTVNSPTQVSFNPSGGFYIGRKTAAERGEIAVRDACLAAYAEYVEWQRSKIGRDVVPDKLRQMLLDAGAKRVVTEMAYASVSNTQWAVPSSSAVFTYWGVEDE